MGHRRAKRAGIPHHSPSGVFYTLAPEFAAGANICCQIKYHLFWRWADPVPPKQFPSVSQEHILIPFTTLRSGLWILYDPDAKDLSAGFLKVLMIL
jgi:hypothetical protein